MNAEKLRGEILSIIAAGNESGEDKPFDVMVIMKRMNMTYSSPNYFLVLQALKSLHMEGLITKERGMWAPSFKVDKEKNVVKRCLSCGFIYKEKYKEGCTKNVRCRNCGSTRMWGDIECDGTERTVKMLPPIQQQQRKK